MQSGGQYGGELVVYLRLLSLGLIDATLPGVIIIRERETRRGALEPRRISQFHSRVDTRAHTGSRKTSLELPPSCILSPSTYSLCTLGDLWDFRHPLSLWQFPALWHQSSLNPKWQCSPGRKCFLLLLLLFHLATIFLLARDFVCWAGRAVSLLENSYFFICIEMSKTWRKFIFKDYFFLKKNPWGYPLVDAKT